MALVLATWSLTFATSLISSQTGSRCIFASINKPTMLPKLSAQRHLNAVIMGGFGGGGSKGTQERKAKTPKPGDITAKQSWELFRQLRESDKVQATTVFARLPDDDAKWLNVGGVIVEAPGNRQQAVNQNKRLILEHAARLHPRLALRSRELVCGYIETGEAPGEVVYLTKCDVPPELRSGFQGLPDIKSGMYMIQGGIKAR